MRKCGGTTRRCRAITARRSIATAICTASTAGRRRRARLRCVEMKSGKVQWTQEGFGCGSMILADGKLIILTRRRRSGAGEGEPRQVRGAGAGGGAGRIGRCRAPIALADGKLYGRDGREAGVLEPEIMKARSASKCFDEALAGAACSCSLTSPAPATGAGSTSPASSPWARPIPARGWTTDTAGRRGEELRRLLGADAVGLRLVQPHFQLDFRLRVPDQVHPLRQHRRRTVIDRDRLDFLNGRPAISPPLSSSRR